MQYASRPPMPDGRAEGAPPREPDTDGAGTSAETPAVAARSGEDETVDLPLPASPVARLDGPLPAPAFAAGTGFVTSSGAGSGTVGAAGGEAAAGRGGDLLDSVADWPASPTPAGMLQLVPVRLERDLRLISAWMNDSAVAAFWELDGPAERTAAHVRGQLDGDGRSVPCLGVLDGVPMSYWEIYRADLDPLALHCRVHPHDTGLHLLVGGVPDRGRGVGTALLRAVADLVLDRRRCCARVLAEPDVRNTPSIAAFLGAGFRYSAEVRLPEKRAALMVRDRELRGVL